MCTYICTATGGGHRELQRLRQTGSVSLQQQAALAPLSHHSDLDNFLHTQTYKYTYNSNRKHIFKQNLLSDTNIERIGVSLTRSEVDKTSIDNCITLLNEALLSSAKKSFPFKNAARGLPYCYVAHTV